MQQDYMPTSEKSTDSMYGELLGFIHQIGNTYLRQIVEYYFVNDEEFIRIFKGHSAAKTVHHGFAGGLLEHTLSVVKFCEYMAGAYPILNKDLLYAAAICHDIGKTKELSPFPENDYTDDGQLLGHIVIDVEIDSEAGKKRSGLSGRFGERIKTLHYRTSRRIRVRFSEKTGIGRSVGVEFRRQHRRKNADIDRNL